MWPPRYYWLCPHRACGCWSSLTPMIDWFACNQDDRGWNFLLSLREQMKGYMKKPAGPAKNDVSTSPWKDADFEKDWPFLAAFLKDVTWDDGTLRETGTMLIFVQEGYLKCCLNDRALDRSAFICAPTLDILFDLAESGLESDKLDWRQRRK